MTPLTMNKHSDTERDMNGCHGETRAPEPGLTRASRPEPAANPGAGRVWAGTATVRIGRDIEPVLRILLDALRRDGFTPREVESVQLSVREAIHNAIAHGHKGDSTKQVRIRYLINPLGLLAQVEDEGQGFRLDWAGGSEPVGRGLRLLRENMTEVRYNACGNCVTLVKRRSSGNVLPS